MLIDTYTPEWLQELEAAYHDRSEGTNIHLLIDGAFVPGLHKKTGAGNPHMLFDGLPGFNETTRDVSPFVVVYEPDDKKLCSMLEDCSGWPMVNAITTVESATDLAKRLAAWCVIEADGQYLNFRFPDTRRLPDILAIFDAKQSAEFTGPATQWRYIGRNGEWRTITLTPSEVAPAVDPKLNPAQFGALVASSDADVILARAEDIGCRPKSLVRSIQYAIAESAIAIGVKHGVQDDMLFWCKSCLESATLPDGEMMEELFSAWAAEELALAQEGIEV
jgi:hypothetical protein